MRHASLVVRALMVAGMAVVYSVMPPHAAQARPFTSCHLCSSGCLSPEQDCVAQGCGTGSVTCDNKACTAFNGSGWEHNLYCND
jgi:hypothetical protein